MAGPRPPLDRRASSCCSDRPPPTPCWPRSTPTATPTAATAGVSNPTCARRESARRSAARLRGVRGHRPATTPVRSRSATGWTGHAARRRAAVRAAGPDPAGCAPFWAQADPTDVVAADHRRSSPAVAPGRRPRPGRRRAPLAGPRDAVLPRGHRRRGRRAARPRAVVRRPLPGRRPRAYPGGGTAAGPPRPALPADGLVLSAAAPEARRCDPWTSPRAGQPGARSSAPTT